MAKSKKLLSIFAMALSSFSLMASFSSFPVRAFPARIQVGYSTMKADTMHPARGASAGDVQHLLKNPKTTSTFIDSLWKNPANEDLVSQFLNNSFWPTCAKASDQVCKPLYQRYYVQDYFYLEDYVKYKALRLHTLPVGDLTTLKAEASSILSSADYVIGFGQDYVKKLGGKASDLDEGNRKVEELAYANWLQSSASSEDWFNLHVVMIPCIYGWPILADKMLNDTSTKNDTIFYSTWIKPNSNHSSADKLSAFLDANQKLWENKIDTGITGKWNNLFRTALKLEIALFASAFKE